MNDEELRDDHVRGDIESDINDAVENEEAFDLLHEIYNLGKTATDDSYSDDVHKMTDIGISLMNHYYKLFKE